MVFKDFLIEKTIDEHKENLQEFIIIGSVLAALIANFIKKKKEKELKQKLIPVIAGEEE